MDPAFPLRFAYCKNWVVGRPGNEAACHSCLHVYIVYALGPEFEGRIRLNEAGNTKFNFLNPHDPYHAYYRHKIVEIQEGVAQEAAAAASQQQAGLKVRVGVGTRW